MSCALASLGDALFGYSQGITASFQVQPSFIHRMYGTDASIEDIRDGMTGVNPFVPGELLLGSAWFRLNVKIAITVACLNITALIASFFAAYVSDILGRRASIRIGAIIYFIAGGPPLAHCQLIAPMSNQPPS